MKPKRKTPKRKKSAKSRKVPVRKEKCEEKKPDVAIPPNNAGGADDDDNQSIDSVGYYEEVVNGTIRPPNIVLPDKINPKDPEKPTFLPLSNDSPNPSASPASRDSSESIK